MLNLTGTEISPLVARVCTIKKRRTPIITALTSNNFKTRKLTGFRVVWTPLGGTQQESALYFDETHTAEAWRELMLLSTDAQPLRAVAPSPPTLPDACATVFQDAPGPSVADSSPHSMSAASADDLQAETASWSGRHPLDFRDHRNDTPQRWAKLKHHNGVAVYLEDGCTDDPQSGQRGGAMMVSAVVRATPRLTFQTLTTIGKQGRNVGNVFADGQLLQAGKDGRDVLLLHFTPGGVLGSIASPRDLVVARTWRLDDDGTYVLLYQSTDHPAAPPGQAGPVRGRVVAAGITISPLAARFCPCGAVPSQSPECLVTLVLNVDPGGWLSPASWLGRCLPGWVRLAWAEPFVLSVIALRDRVEQSRFAVQPFSLVEWSPPDPVKDAGQPLPATQASFLIPRASVRRGDYSTVEGSPLRLHHTRSNSGSAPTHAPTPSLDGMHDAFEVLPEAEGEGPGALLSPDQWRYAEGTCPPEYWECPGATGYRVRGPSYLLDRRKVPAAEPVFTLTAVDLLRFKAPRKHVAPLLPSMRASTAPFTLIVNILIPGPPHLSLIMSWAAEYNPDATHGAGNGAVGVPSSPSIVDESEGELDDLSAPVDIAMARFLAGGDAERNATFKLIPRIAKGSWIIKQSVGSTPVILGRKLQCTYYRGQLEDSGACYLEVDVDVASSSVAAHVVGLVQNATKSLIVDMAWLLEGGHADELPEALLGTVRFNFVDLNRYRWMDVEDGGRVYEQGEEPQHLHG